MDKVNLSMSQAIHVHIHTVRLTTFQIDFENMLETCFVQSEWCMNVKSPLGISGNLFLLLLRFEIGYGIMSMINSIVQIRKYLRLMAIGHFLQRNLYENENIFQLYPYRNLPVYTIAYSFGHNNVVQS